MLLLNAIYHKLILQTIQILLCQICLGTFSNFLNPNQLNTSNLISIQFYHLMLFLIHIKSTNRYSISSCNTFQIALKNLNTTNSNIIITITNIIIVILSLLVVAIFSINFIIISCEAGYQTHYPSKCI